VRPSSKVILLSTVSLLVLGVLMVTSAAMSLDADPFTPQDVLRSKTGLFFALAVGAMLLSAMLPVRSLVGLITSRAEGSCLPIAGVAIAGAMLLIIALLPYIPPLRHEVNSSRRWIHIASLTFQPSEIVKWGLVVLLALALSLRIDRVRASLRGTIPILAGAAIVIAPVALEDLGTGVLLVAVTGAMLLIAGATWWKLAPLAIIPASAVALLIALEPYRLARIRTFLNPFADPAGEGYHVIQSMGTIAGGHGVGRGLGLGIQKFGYLPEDRTDFVFSVVNEELGLAGTALIIFLYLAILWSAYAVARRERVLALKLMTLGVLSTLGIQTCINLLVVTGWAPAKGIPLPLLSAGGTGWIMTAASLGLIISIDRSRKDPAAIEDDLDEPEDVLDEDDLDEQDDEDDLDEQDEQEWIEEDEWTDEWEDPEQDDRDDEGRPER